MVRLGTNKGLAQQLVSSGSYVIDEHAVAEAMLNRMKRGELPRSAVLVAGQPGNGRPAGVGEDRAGAGPRLS
jgi:hypothetical protein